MARKKVKLAWIANDSSRKATYKKRKKGLIKKVSELSTLCSVNACAIVFGPTDQQPEVWPSVADVQRVVLMLKSLPEMEQSKKMMNQEGFLRQRMDKLKEQLKKQQRDNRQAEITLLMYQSLSGKGLQEASIEDLSDLMWLVESKMKMVHDRIEVINGSMSKRREKEERIKMKGDDGSKALEEVVAMEMEALQRQQWFMDMLNPQEHMVCGGEEMVLPFGDNNPWLDACYP